MTKAYKSIESEDKKFLNCRLASDWSRYEKVM